jgi:hypothetical protein
MRWTPQPQKNPAQLDLGHWEEDVKKSLGVRIVEEEEVEEVIRVEVSCLEEEKGYHMDATIARFSFAGMFILVKKV